MSQAELMYKEMILDLYKHPLNKGQLDTATHTSTCHNPLCGDKITIQMNVVDGIILTAMHDGVGCAISQAASSLLTDHLKGRCVTEVREFTNKVVFTLLGFEPVYTRIKCATLSLEAAKNALHR